MLLAMPLLADAAGLGRLNVRSGLGQPFRGEIDLTQVTAEEADSLVVSLASPDAHANAGVPYPSSALGLRFNIERRGGGQYYVMVNSAASIGEPFLNLLVELNWAGGRIQREYTALIDPVEYTPSRASSALPGKVVRGKSTPVATAPADSTPAAAPAPSPSAQPAKPRVMAGDEVRTKTGDTLSGIAKQVQPSGVALDQVLVSLYRNNIGAFDGNMNRLKRGAILKVPTTEQMKSVSRGEASAEVKLQSDNWRSYRNQVADSAAAAPSAPQQQAVSGKIKAQVEDKGAQQQANRDQLKLSKGDSPKNVKDLSSAQSRIRALEEEAASRQKQLDEASQRVNELEKLVADMSKALPPADKKGAQPTPAATPVPTPEAQPASAVAAVAASAVASGTAVAAMPASEAASAPAPKKKRRAPVEIEAPVEEETSFVGDLMGNPLVMGGGLLAALLAGGALWWSRRRRPSVFEDSIITGGDLKPNTVLGSTGGAVISTQPTENSFLTDFSRQGLGTIDADEVDPVAEAEVYMAYGRDAQAEEILKDALSKDPTRNELRMKLLEIYSARKDKTSYEEVAADLYARTSGAGPLWEQAAYNGRVLDAENPLYAKEGEARIDTSAAPAAKSSLNETTMVAAAAAGAGALDLELGQDEPAPAPVPAAEAEPFAETQPAELDPLGDLDFDLGEPAASVPEVDPVVAAPAEPDPLADFAASVTGAFKADELTSSAPAEDDFKLPEAVTDDGESALDSLDFDLGSDFAPEPAFEAPAPVPAAEPEEDEFDLSSELVMPEVKEELGADEFGLDMSFDLDSVPDETPAAPAPAIDIDSTSLGDLDFTSKDPVQTKIDLARAYIEMGDVEGAREILQEAMSEGNDDQQGQARGLLDSL
ncbi:FimV/HubP family polar landmark protein [Chitinibacteraceae bacterium HSL-7]